ncbi:MAG: DUF3823 domain-containing protein [Zunongwangia sp.]|uniref:DUF3823 domain-containing protein n=1 Tax=Zunongwangia sp. TaxID=1965325 RepID=UPI002354C99C
MKLKYYILFMGLVLSLASCEIDNYEEPQSFFTGNVVYDGMPIEVGPSQVRFQLWQPGFGALAPLDVNIAPDGSYSGRFFDGDYKLKFVNGQGPWIAQQQSAQAGDTIFFSLNGDTMMDIEVTPYYIVQNSEISLNGGRVNASVDLDQIITGDNGRGIEYVNLYLNKTELVSNWAEYNINDGDRYNDSESYGIVQEGPGDLSDINNINLSVNLPNPVNYDRDYIFARVGIKILGIEDLLFTPTVKLEL